MYRFQAGIKANKIKINKSFVLPTGTGDWLAAAQQFFRWQPLLVALVASAVIDH